MKPYPKYQDSWIEWIGEVPEEWNVKKLKYLFSLTTEKAVNISKKIALENIESQTGNFIETDTLFEGEGIKFRINDLLYGKLRPYLAKVYIADFEGSAVGDFFVLRGCSEICPRFFLYKLLERKFTDLADSSTFGAKMPRVSWEFLSDMIFSYPSLSEQTAIAAFLDRKTAEIDSIISKKERLIELYKEEKAAVINHAVTKGLDSAAKMKDSGIEWLGQIPEHWEVKQIKYIAELKSGDTITSEKIAGNGKYPVYGGNGFRGYCDSYTHDGEYMLIGRQGALCGNINYASGKFWASEHAIVAIFKREYKLIWFGELLRVMNLNQYSVSAAQPGLSVDNIKRLFVPVPSENEQTAIVQHIETQCSHIDAIISKFKRQIELLKEYRTALISEAVTGKIDVRNQI